MTRPHCLIYEPDAMGHRLQHVRHLADALLEIGCEVTIALQTNCREMAEYKVHLAALESRVNIYGRLDHYFSVTFMARRRRVNELTAVIAELKPDWAYVPYADGITQVAALQNILSGGNQLCRTPIEAQIMRGKYGYPQRSMIDAANSAANRFFTRRSPWKVTHVLDPFAFNGLKPLPNENRFRLIPEPVESLPDLDQRAARAALDVPTDGRYLAFVGGLYAYKGIEFLVESFAKATLADDDRLLFVGQTSRPIRDLLYRNYEAYLREGRIIVIDRYVSDHELGCAFLAADVVGVTHPRPIGSSGTLVRGVAAKRLLLSTDFGWVGWATNTFQLGTTVNITNIPQFSVAIAAAIEQSRHYRPGTAAERFRSYHTVANQKAHWVAEVGRAYGLAVDTQSKPIEWDWVLEAVGKAAN